MHEMACPECGYNLRLWRDAEGWAGHCAQCNAAIAVTHQVLAPGEAPPVPSEPAAASAPDYPVDQPLGEAATPAGEVAPAAPAGELPGTAFDEPTGSDQAGVPAPDVPEGQTSIPATEAEPVTPDQAPDDETTAGETPSQAPAEQPVSEPAPAGETAPAGEEPSLTDRLSDLAPPTPRP